MPASLLMGNRALVAPPLRFSHRPQIAWSQVRPTTRQAVGPQAISGSSCTSVAARAVAVPVGPLAPTGWTRMAVLPSHHVARKEFVLATHAVPPGLPCPATQLIVPNVQAGPSAAAPPPVAVTVRASRAFPFV